jgi:hypothetical protein
MLSKHCTAVWPVRALSSLPDRGYRLQTTGRGRMQHLNDVRGAPARLHGSTERRRSHLSQPTRAQVESAHLCSALTVKTAVFDAITKTDSL